MRPCSAPRERAQLPNREAASHKIARIRRVVELVAFDYALALRFWHHDFDFTGDLVLPIVRHKAEPPASDLSLCVEVLDLGENTVVALVQDPEAHPPVNARENTVLVVLLERWALTAPEAAARWMVQKGNGTTRQPLPLAVSRIAFTNAELAATLADYIPEDTLHLTAMDAIVYALATRDHREACEFSERHGHQFDAISRDWRRADRGAAESWLQARWLDQWQ